jgi:hypothetical protein
VFDAGGGGIFRQMQGHFLLMGSKKQDTPGAKRQPRGGGYHQTAVRREAGARAKRLQ